MAFATPILPTGNIKIENLKENEERKRNKRQLSKCVVCLTQAELYFYDAFIFFVITQPSCSYKLCFYKKMSIYVFISPS